MVPGYPAPYSQNQVYRAWKTSKTHPLSSYDNFSVVMLGYRETEGYKISKIMEGEKVDFGEVVIAK